jgi:hypothetical protein
MTTFHVGSCLLAIRDEAGASDFPSKNFHWVFVAAPLTASGDRVQHDSSRNLTLRSVQKPACTHGYQQAEPA